MADWSKIESVSELMNFQKDELKTQNDPKFSNALMEGFKNKLKVVSVSLFKLT